jgi:ribosome-binding protein aMBF1 (putative translation factor)
MEGQQMEKDQVDPLDKLVRDTRERNRAAIEAAERKSERIARAVRRSEGVVNRAERKLRRASRGS